MEVRLREVRDEDLPVFWEHLSDPLLHHTAAFTRAYHYDRDAFDRFWATVRTAPSDLLRTVVADSEIAGSAAVFGTAADREVTYSLGRAFWGRGIATRALTSLIALEETRPLYAEAAADNTGSLRVLEKCGFRAAGAGREFARARGAEIDVVRLVLD